MYVFALVSIVVKTNNITEFTRYCKQIGVKLIMIKKEKV